MYRSQLHLAIWLLRQPLNDLIHPSNARAHIAIVIIDLALWPIAIADHYGYRQFYSLGWFAR